MEDLNDVYNELIMEHSMNSYNKKKLNNADFSGVGHNPNCGDEITLELKLDEPPQRVMGASFSIVTCAVFRRKGGAEGKVSICSSFFDLFVLGLLWRNWEFPKFEVCE